MKTDDRALPRRLLALRPEPTRFWIRRRFPTWPGPASLWTDLASGRLGTQHSGELPAVEEFGAGGWLTYLPPVRSGLESRRRIVAQRLVELGTPVVLQVELGDRRSECDGVHCVVDVLTGLLADDVQKLDLVPRGAMVAWPLIAGITDREELWHAGCERLARAGADVVQAVVLAVDPPQRRRLLDGRTDADEAFDRLFHAKALDERAFARVAASYGLAPFWRRAAAGSDRVAQNHQVAEILALGGEISLRLGHEMQGQDLYRASRWADAAAVDIRALAADGNAQIVPWLRGPALALLREWSRSARSATVDEWLMDYLGTRREELEDGSD